MGGQKSENFGSRFGAIMSMVGMCFGLGSVWRFPFLAGEYGGGAFVLAYTIVMLAIVVPLCLVEMAVGKGFGRGLIDTYAIIYKNEKVGKILGIFSGLIYYSMNFFFITILAIAAYFMYACAVGLWDTIPPQEIYEHATSNKPLITGLFMALCLLTGFVVYKGVNDGIEAFSKKVVPLKFILLIAVIFYGAFAIPNITKGYNFYFSPDFSRLASIDIWIAAVGQALFAVGVGPGCILIYSSYLNKNVDVPLNSLNVCMLVLSGGIIAGMAILPACIALNLDPASGSRLIFVVLPTIFSQVPFGEVVGVLFFLTIVAAITSAIAQLEVIVKTLSDKFGTSRAKSVSVLTIITMCAAIPGIYFEEIKNFWEMVAASYGFIVTAGIGAVSFAWVYGVKVIRENFINPSTKFPLGVKFDFWIKYVAVPVMMVILVNSIFPFI